MKRWGIIVNKKRPDAEAVVAQLVAWMRERKIDAVVESDVSVEGAEKAADCEVSKYCNMMLALGGDGTILRTVHLMGEHQKPILGINLGSLGFLTETSQAEMWKTLESVDSGRYRTEERAMALAECGGVQYHALNDLDIRVPTRLIELTVEVDKEFLNRYYADGLLVATPTGSTAYSLAAGGPVVSPEVSALVITPISPHMLTHRPVVVKDSRTVKILVIGTPEEAFLTVDGQVGIRVFEGDHISCKKSNREVRLLRHADRTFFDVLRMKLKWGER